MPIGRQRQEKEKEPAPAAGLDEAVDAEQDERDEERAQDLQVREMAGAIRGPEHADSGDQAS